jgi:cytoskeletal protein CcmA (bactofilin family)
METFGLRQLLALSVALLVLLGAGPTVAMAQTSQTGGTVVVGPDETVSGGLEVVAGTVVVHGTVEGDLQAVGGTVLIDETGTVTGNAEMTGGSIVVAGTVGGDAAFAGGSFLLREAGSVGGTLEGGAGDVRLDGAVAGDATVGAETLTVGSTAVLSGQLEYDAGTFTREDGSQVAGTVVRNPDLVTGTDFAGFEAPVLPWWVGQAYGFLVNLALGAVLLLVAPAFAGRVTGLGTRKALRSGGAGLLTFVGVPLLLVFVALTIVGIPLSLVGALLFAIALWIGSVFGAYVVGTYLLRLADRENRWGALVLGLAVVAILTAIPYGLGGILGFFVLLLGLGAFALALRGEGGDEGDEGLGATEQGPSEGQPMA